MSFLACIAEIQRREQRKNISLKECDQQFQKIHENHEGRREETNTHTCNRCFPAFSKDEDQTREGQDDDVACRDVGCESNHENQWLHENTDDFNGRQNQHLDRHGNTGHPQNVAPIMLVATEVGDEENQGRQNNRHAQRTCNVETTNEWDQTQ